MILQYHTTEIDRSAANPKTLNEWLQKNGGYDDKSNVNFGVIRNLKTIKYTETITNVGRLKGNSRNNFRALLLGTRYHTEPELK